MLCANRFLLGPVALTFTIGVQTVGHPFINLDVVDSFFRSLKKERIRRRIYRTREEARADVFA